MKRIINSILLIASAAILFYSCDGSKNKNAINPIFASQPELKAITEDILSSPKNAELYYNRGQMLRKLHYDTLALADYKMAVSLDSNKAAYYSIIGDLLFENKDLEGSVIWLQKAIDKNPKDPRAHLKIAKLFLYIKDYPKAFGEINVVLRSDIYNPEAYFLKGMVYKDMNDTAKAISSFQTVLQVAPDYKEASNQLGLLYTAKKDDVGVKYFENAYRMDTTDVRPLFNKAVYLQNKNQKEEAIQLYRKCIAKDIHFIDAYFNLGFLYMEQDSVQKALHMYDMITKVQPDNPTAYYDRGVCYERLNKMPEAINDYKMAARLDTGYSSPKLALKNLSEQIKKK